MEYNSLRNNPKNNILKDTNFLELLKTKFPLNDPSILKKIDQNHKVVELLSVIEKNIK